MQLLKIKDFRINPAQIAYYEPYHPKEISMEHAIYIHLTGVKYPICISCTNTEQLEYLVALDRHFSIYSIDNAIEKITPNIIRDEIDRPGPEF